jgi:hypothetical protein
VFNQMGSQDNMLAFGFQSLVAFAAPVFAGSSSCRGVSDYFLEAGEYLGKGFVRAGHEAKNQSTNEKQLDLFEARGDH